MSEYWKSTPNYWCKHCKTYVRDTALERRNHESTPRHQGAISRFLKDLHRTNEREAREAQRAKQEVARLNGIPTSHFGQIPATAVSKTHSNQGSQSKATPEDRKRQLAQLAAMGVAVPEEFRRENAMAGDWQIAEPHPIVENSGWRPLGKDKTTHSAGTNFVKTEEKSSDERKIDTTIGLNELESDNNGENYRDSKRKRKPNWGSDTKAYRRRVNDDLDTLLDSTTIIKKSDPRGQNNERTSKPDISTTSSRPIVFEKDEIAEADAESAGEEKVKVQSVENIDDVGAIFKKRKPKTKS